MGLSSIGRGAQTLQCRTGQLGHLAQELGAHTGPKTLRVI
jgi:hypothetical protein